MNSPIPIRLDMQKPSMEREFRQALTDPRTKPTVMKAIGWDESQVSRFLSGGMGITIDKIDSAIAALGSVVTSSAYMDFLAYGAKIGANCHCARAGMGECGRH